MTTTTEESGTITDKDFPPLLLLIERARKVIPGIYGKVDSIKADWVVAGLLGIHLKLLQDPPTEDLKNYFVPGYHLLYFIWRPYREGCYGARGWEVFDHGRGRWWLPFEPSDAYLKPCQTSRMRDFPNYRKWDGSPLFVGTDSKIDQMTSAYQF